MLGIRIKVWFQVLVNSSRHSESLLLELGLGVRAKFTCMAEFMVIVETTFRTRVSDSLFYLFTVV